MGRGGAASSAPGGGEGTLVGVLADPVLGPEGRFSGWRRRPVFEAAALVVVKGMSAVR